MIRNIVVTLIAVLIIIVSFNCAQAGYSYVTLDVPGADSTVATGISGNNIVGYYNYPDGRRGSFLYNGTTYTTFYAPGGDVPGALTYAYGIDGNNIVGKYWIPNVGMSNDSGFLYNGTTFTPISPPVTSGSMDEVAARGISGNNIIVTRGEGFLGVSFLYNGSSYTTLEIPGSPTAYGIPTSSAYGISGNNIVGRYTSAGGVEHDFLYDGTTYSILAPVPDSDNSYVRGISGNNIVGYYAPPMGWMQGFIYDGTTYTTLNVAGSHGTYAYDVDGRNVVGYYVDASGVQHGFVATTNNTPIPAALFLFAPGLGAIVMLRKKLKK